MEPVDKSPVQQLLEIRNGRPLEQHLRELYVDRRFNDREIARAWGVSRATIREWRRQFGIDASQRAAVA